MITTEEKISIELSREEAALILTIRNLGYGYIEGINVRNGRPIQWKNVTARVDLTQPHQAESLLQLSQALQLTNAGIRAEFEALLGHPIEPEDQEN